MEWGDRRIIHEAIPLLVRYIRSVTRIAPTQRFCTKWGTLSNLLRIHGSNRPKRDGVPTGNDTIPRPFVLTGTRKQRNCPVARDAQRPGCTWEKTAGSPTALSF